MSIHNKEENNLIKRLINQTNQDVWIGIHDRSYDQWSDGSVVNFTDWIGNGSSSGRGTPYAQNCGQLSKQINLKWDYDDCSTTKRYICGKPGK